jgi:hypothetical protein
VFSNIQRREMLNRIRPGLGDERSAISGLVILPEVCPWSLAQVLDEDFLPEA